MTPSADAHEASADARTAGDLPSPRPAPDEEPVAARVQVEHAAESVLEPVAAEVVRPDTADGQPTGPDPAEWDPSEPDLTERERAILAFEQRWWRHAGAKEQAIRDNFGLSATRYYQMLNALLDKPAALAAEPMLVGRLRRLRATRSRSRRR